MDRLTLRQRLGATYRARGMEPKAIAATLHLNERVVAAWDRSPTFEQAVNTRREYHLRARTVAALEAAYERERALRLDIAGRFDHPTGEESSS